jgi:hypothetical protein
MRPTGVAIRNIQDTVPLELSYVMDIGGFDVQRNEKK